MKHVSVFVSLFAAAALAGANGCMAGRPPPKKPYPKATPPPPPSEVYTLSPERAPTLAEIEKSAREHNSTLAGLIERALAGEDALQREAAFAILLPVLLQVDPQRVTDMVKRQRPGEARDLLRDEVAQLWIARDRDAAIDWMRSMDSRAEQLASARVAVAALAPVDPAQAIFVADQFGIGRDDGSLEGLVKGWAAENPEAVLRWIDAQPDGPRTREMRAHIERVMASREQHEPLR